MGTCSQLYHEGNIPIMCIIRLLLVYYVYYKVFTVCYEGKNSNITSYKMDKATLKKKKTPPKKTQKTKHWPPLIKRVSANQVHY